MPISGLDEVVSISPLQVTREGRPTLEVPLDPVEETQRTRILLFEGGPVWEDEEAGLGFSVETTAFVKRATVSVNDHKDLWTACEWLPNRSYEGETTYRYEFVVTPEVYDAAYTTPFSLTCGLARVTVMLEFRDGREALFESRDIVCLDEPHTVGKQGDRAEEGNVGEMYRTLVAAQGNQATEWMFAPTPEAGDVVALSDDDDTDWAHAELAHVLEVASETLDLVYDGLEDEGDSFPNETNEPGRASTFDTDENRAVRSLLASVTERAGRVRKGLEDSISMLDALVGKLSGIVAEAEASRGQEQTLPVIALFERQRAQEASWLAQAADLEERAKWALQDFDEFVGGAGKVGVVEFELPRLSRLYAEDERYAQLYEAMCEWASVSQESAESVDVSLYAIKPDRLFEYYALQRMLTWLFEAGFREDMSRPCPISRHVYGLARTYGKYENEWRCANTYHLARTKSDGSREEVDVYYQPVIYGSRREENGVTLHRIGSPDVVDGGMWTPDYLLVIRDSKGERAHLIDAKYVPWSTVVGKGGRLAECVQKYLAQTSCNPDGAPGEGVAGVWVLCGRLSAKSMTVLDAEEAGMVEAGVLGEGISRLCGAVPWNRYAGKRRMGAFFAQLGLAPLQSA